jgi:hypothetical protein
MPEISTSWTSTDLSRPVEGQQYWWRYLKPTIGKDVLNKNGDDKKDRAANLPQEICFLRTQNLPRRNFTPNPGPYLHLTGSLLKNIVIF